MQTEQTSFSHLALNPLANRNLKEALTTPAEQQCIIKPAFDFSNSVLQVQLSKWRKAIRTGS